MWKRLRRWLDDIASPDPIDHQAARLLEVMLIGLIVAAALALLLTLVFSPHSPFSAPSVASAGIAVIITVGALILLRRGWVKLAAWIEAIGLLFTSTIVLVPAGLATNGVLLMTFAAPIALSSLLLGRRGLLLISGVSVGIVAVTAILEHLSPPLAGFARDPGLNSWLITGVFILIVSVLGLFLDHFGSSLRAALAELQATNERLRGELAERQRAEAALRESETTYRLLMDQAADGIAIADQDGQYLAANSRMCDMLGYTLQELQRLNVRDVVAPEDLAAGRLRFDELRTGKTMLSERRLRRKDGTLLAVEISARLLDNGRFQAIVRDITERKRAREALHKSEELYRTLAHHFPNGAVMLFDSDLRYTLVDGAGLAEIGLSSEDMEGKTIWEVFPPETCELIEPEYRAALAGTPTLTDIPYQDHIYAQHALPVKNHRGEIFAGMVMTQDVTQQVRAAETLRRQNAYLTDLHETSLALINRLEVADLLQEIVERAARLLGAQHGYLYLVEPEGDECELKVGIGRFHSKVGFRVKPGEGLTGKVWQAGQTIVIDEYDTWPERTPGLPFGIYHTIVGTPLKLGAQVVGVLGLAHTEPGRCFSEDEIILLNGFAQLAAIAFDSARLYAEAQRELTARTQAIAALRDSEELYRLITENTRDLITLLDQEGCCMYASPSCSGILGYAPVELIGTAITDLVHPDDQASVVEQMAHLAASGAAQATFRARHAGGAWRWIETFWTATVQDGARYNVAVGRDITERKRLEAQFLQAQKMEGIGRLAGGVAHDFNNLLTAIMSYTELARDGLAPGDPVSEDLDEVTRAARRAADLTSQLLAFARKQIIEPQALNLNNLLEGMDRLLRRVIGEDVELQIRPAPELGYVKADPGQIEQVLINLAVNARDAMPNGGKLIVETRDVTLDAACAEQHIGMGPGAYVLIEVSDTGVGMDAETQRQVFEPFFTTKERGRGTGLGLATCYGIIKQHGGSIALYSEAGFGSTFKIYLPRVAEPAAPAPRHEESAATPHGSETILLAEDEPAVRTLASRVLRERGYVVIEAANGHEALRAAEERDGAEIDLLLTDMVMPKMGGGALAERLKALYPGIRVLFISGYTDSTLIHHGQFDGGTEFMHKPFSPTDLARKVRELLDA
jgi:two-component system, cell cycle sensor histidine kinase and response regulator CckA